METSAYHKTKIYAIATGVLWRIKYTVQLALLLAIVTIVNANAQNDGRNSIVFVIDGSNSMWGQIDGVNKIVIMRRAFAKNQNLIPIKQNLAIIAYGHNNQDGCSDIKIEFKTQGKTNKNEFIKKINGISPKGNTPIAKAINIALGQIKQNQQNQNHIVLITDGVDNCGGKIKNIAQKIKKQFPKTQTHVIAFDLKERHLEQFRYLTQQTNGLFYNPHNNKTFDNALREILEKLHQTNNKIIKTNNKIIKTKPVDVDIGGFYKQKQIRLSAVVAQNTPALIKGVKWEIIREYLNGEFARQVVRKYDESDILVGGLGSGIYTAIAYYGYASAQAKFEIKKQNQFDTQMIIVNLNAGGLRVKAFVAGSQTPIENELVIVVKENEQKEYRIDNINDNTFYRLNAGTYQIIGNYGDVNSQIRGEIIIEPGKLTEAIINFRAGKLIFRLVNETLDKQQIEEIYWKFFDKKGTLILATDSISPSHIFNSGSYDLEVIYQGKNYRSTFNVETGKNKIVEVLIR